MNITKLKSGSYRIREMRDNKSYSVTVDHKPTKREAMQLIQDKVNQSVIDKANITFNTAAKLYIDSKKNVLSPSTIREYTGTLERLSSSFRDTRICEINQIHVQNEINTLASTRSPKTVRNYHGFISSVLSQNRPDLVLRTTLPQKQKKDIYIPTNDEVRQIIQHSAGSEFEIPLMLACIGLRRSEICALTIDDLEGNVIHINKAMVMDVDKNWVIKTTKTTESTRDVLLPDILVEKIHEQGFIYNGHPNSITDYLDHVQKILGINHFSLHKLRHFFVSSMSELGMDPETIQRMGGWQTDYVMKNVYRHLMKESYLEKQKKASDQIGNLFVTNS